VAQVPRRSVPGSGGACILERRCWYGLLPPRVKGCRHAVYKAGTLWGECAADLKCRNDLAGPLAPTGEFCVRVQGCLASLEVALLSPEGGDPKVGVSTL
jgi:hypothetical protein